jgi:uracil-DNA glycosylase family 4
LFENNPGTDKTAKADLSSDWQDFYWIRRFVEAGVGRKRIYATNAVNRFKFEPRGKRRLRKRPNASEIKICRRWLFQEIEAISPRIIVALGATAAQGLLGKAILFSAIAVRSSLRLESFA